MWNVWFYNWTLYPEFDPGKCESSAVLGTHLWFTLMVWAAPLNQLVCVTSCFKFHMIMLQIKMMDGGRKMAFLSVLRLWLCAGKWHRVWSFLNPFFLLSCTCPAANSSATQHVYDNIVKTNKHQYPVSIFSIFLDLSDLHNPNILLYSASILPFSPQRVTRKRTEFECS